MRELSDAPAQEGHFSEQVVEGLGQRAHPAGRAEEAQVHKVETHSGKSLTHTLLQLSSTVSHVSFLIKIFNAATVKL